MMIIIAGRLDKCVFCPIPTAVDREEILEVLSRDVDVGEDVSWAKIAAITENFTGADLQSLLSTAQILVAQEALGDTMYKDIIPGDFPLQGEEEEAGVCPSLTSSRSWEIENIDNITVSADKVRMSEMLGADNLGLNLKKIKDTIQAGVIIKKEKVKQNVQSVSSQEGNSDEDLDDFERLDDSCIISHHQEADDNGIASDNGLSSDDQSNSVDYKIYKQHIEAALREIKPSVTAADRNKYELLYTTFTNSHEGNFGQPSPGKRATLA